MRVRQNWELYRMKRATREQIRKILSLAALPQSWKDRVTAKAPFQLE
jgi:hypothetical protein